MSARLRNQSGQVIVLAAVMIPVFLLLTALVLDTGNWFSHKRQLQNRADAAALAAGYELSQRWPGCITDSTSEDVITGVAKRFSGDPNDPGAVNTEVANQSHVDTAVNSTSYDAGTDETDGGGPCFDHPANPAPEGESNITPDGGTWIDVKVKERDTKSFAGAFGVDLHQNRARARVELLEESEGDQFLPLAIPDTGIVKARIRFKNECTGAYLTAGEDLKPLNDQSEASGMTLWGPDPSGTATEVAPGGRISIPNPSDLTGCPAMTDNGSDYVPIGVELRVAGRPDIDLSDARSCAAINAGTSSDCFSRISQIRVYQDEGGLVGDRPQIRNVTLSPSGTSPCSLDAYYARLATGATNCTFDATVMMDWGPRPGPASAFTATIEVDGSTAKALTGTPPLGPWTAFQVPASTAGPDDVIVHWHWKFKGADTWEGKDCSKGQGCEQQGNTRVHHVNLADDPSTGDSPSDAVAAIKLTELASINSNEIHSVATSSTGGPAAIDPVVTVGLRSPFQPGQWAVLRLKAGQRNFSVICDPYWAQPSSVDSMAAFYYGCQAPYAPNDTSQDSFWWNKSTQSCPASSSWFSYSGSPPNVTYPHSPWECLQLDVGGNGFTVGDGIALATENCLNPNVDPLGPGAQGKCQSHKYTCNHGINYKGGTDFPGTDDPRVVKLFVVPYQAYKNVQSGNGQVVPVLQLAAFYVTAWHFNNGDDPCTNPGDGGGTFGNDNARLGSEQIGGYFIKLVEPSAGPANPEKQCDPGDVDVCTTVLTR